MAAPPRFGSVAVVVCDSVGCGGAPDADAFGDAGANTLGHVVEQAGVVLPNLAGLGAGQIPGVPDLGAALASDVPSAAGRMLERGPAKDTMLGHWELMGIIAAQPFPVYPEGFPPAVIDRFRDLAGVEALGNIPASGTEILEQLGSESLRTGRPIVYTSGDSVFQVAAHVERTAVEELHELCRQARTMLHGEHAVGRVIARPFRGDDARGYERVHEGRLDLPLPPPSPTALDVLVEHGIEVHAVGKIRDIFAGRGISSYEKTADNAAGVDATVAALRARRAPLIFTNLVDFDSHYGHRNDVDGYAAALVEFDRALPRLLAALPSDGLLIITADHGNDPTWPGTDHTREAVPLIVAGPGVTPGSLGTRESFADLAATLLENFGVAERLAGESFLDSVSRRAD